MRGPRKGKMGGPRQDRFRKHVDLNADIQIHNEDALIEHLEALGDSIVLILDGVQDPQNLGAIMRTADGAGVAAIIVPKDNSVKITETVVTVASGAAERCFFAQVTNLSRCMERLKEIGYWTIGTSDAATKLIYEVDLKGSLALVMGAEGKGMRHLTMKQCDDLVKLPMLGEVECLNVSVSTGVCLYEAVRQRMA